jgi:hypothetical protein
MQPEITPSFTHLEVAVLSRILESVEEVDFIWSQILPAFEQEEHLDKILSAHDQIIIKMQSIDLSQY